MADAPSEDEGEKLGDQLAVRGTAYVEAFVELIRDKTVRPILAGARFVVYGFVALVVASLIAIALLIAVVRVLTDVAFNGKVWITDLVVGGILLGSGAFLVWLGLRPRKGD